MKFIISILIILSLSSCFERINKHGYVFERSNFKFLKEGVTSKKEVLSIIGSPSIKQDINFDNSWIYFGQDIESFLFFKPKVIDRKIIIIDFDNENIIKDMRYVKLSDGKNFRPYNRYTSVKGHKEPGLIADLFGNIGQVKPQ